MGVGKSLGKGCLNGMSWAHPWSSSVAPFFLCICVCLHALAGVVTLLTPTHLPRVTGNAPGRLYLGGLQPCPSVYRLSCFMSSLVRFSILSVKGQDNRGIPWRRLRESGLEYHSPSGLFLLNPEFTTDWGQMGIQSALTPMDSDLPSLHRRPFPQEGPGKWGVASQRAAQPTLSAP